MKVGRRPVRVDAVEKGPMLSKKDFRGVGQATLILDQSKREILIQESACPDSFVSISDSTALLR